MTFNPATLAGKRLWLRAKDNAGANGSAITTWADQSGDAHDGTSVGTPPTVITGATPLGGKSVRFGGGGYISLSNALPVPGASGDTITASTFYGSGGFEPSGAIDGNPGTAWASSTGAVPQWLLVYNPVASVKTLYSITGNSANPNDTPRDWTFEGSNDGTNFTTLDTRSGIIFSGGTPQTFTLTNTTAYNYHRLYITANNSGNYVRVAELSFATPPSVEMWVVVKSNGSGGAILNAWNAGQQAPIYPDGGMVYEVFGRQDRAVFAPTLAVSSWRIYRVYNDLATWEATLDGVQQSIASSKALPVWAATWGIGTNGYTNSLFDIAEILIRSQVSTAQEVSDITAYLTAEHFVAPVPVGPTAQMAFTWGGVKYAKGDVLPEFRESQMRHLRQRGYANSGTALVVGKPFKHGGTAYARGGVMPVGLTDAQLRRLIASRHLV